MRICYFVMALISVLGCSSQENKQFNFDFETLRPDGKMAKGWFRASDYRISLDDESYSGSYSGKITSDENGYEGRIAYILPVNYKGDTLKLQGYMKLKNVRDGYAGLFMRMEGAFKGNPGFVRGFEKMEDQNVQGTKDWQKYTIALPLVKQTDYVYIGGILTGKGEAWFDEFKVTIDGKEIESLKSDGCAILGANLDKEFDLGSDLVFPETDAKLTENLALLGKTWGFLKYHHPSIAKGTFNWDYELFRFLPVYMEQNSQESRDEVISKWIASFGELESCGNCSKTSSDAFLKPDHDWIENGEFSKKLRRQLLNIYENRYQGEQFYINSAENVGNPLFANENDYAMMPFPDKGFRLLSLFRYWNIIHYYFPYRHLVEKDWREVLKEYIPVFLNVKNELEYELATLKLIGEIQDTHANLGRGSNKLQTHRGKFYPPFKLKFVDDKLVVSEYVGQMNQSNTELKVGAVITKINGKEVSSIIDSIKIYYPASNNAAQMRNIADDILRSPRKSIQLTYTSNDKTKTEELILNYSKRLYNKNGNSFKLLNENIGYINLGTLRSEEIDKAMELFMDKKGIIIDIRNYPNTFVPFALGKYFVSTKTPFAKFTKPNLNNPGEFRFSESVKIPPASEVFKGKLVVLVNELSQSQSEYTAMAFRAGDNTTIVGGTTAGADGNVSQIVLPGGMSTKISGIGVYYPDGKETQKIGIVPDIEVHPTIQGIKEGRDEVLQRAIEVINE